MQIKKAFIIILDISGYTNFVKLHKVSLIHAEKIISELFESIIDSSTNPLVLNKLEGDAALFYAITDNPVEMSQEIKRQLEEMFAAFKTKEGQLVSACQMCICEACNQVKELKLKAIVHYGEILLKQVSTFQEIAGADVILAHRFLKNSIKEKEYILMSDAFYSLSGGLNGLSTKKKTATYDNEKVGMYVSYPNNTAETAESYGFWANISLYSKIVRHWLGRIFQVR